MAKALIIRIPENATPDIDPSSLEVVFEGGAQVATIVKDGRIEILIADDKGFIRTKVVICKHEAQSMAKGLLLQTALLSDDTCRSGSVH